MAEITLGFLKAIELIASGDPEVWSIIGLTLRVSGTATLLSLLMGVPLGLWLAFREFPGKGVLMSLVNLGMGLPPVAAGLVVSLLLWRSGPLGDLRLIYTPTAMIIAQMLLAFPIITGLTFAAIQQLNPKLRLQVLSLGANPLQTLWTLVKEARYSLMAAVMAGFGGAISEVGASMMVGGNIRGETRVLTTATVMEVSKGNFELAMALSIILLTVAYGITVLLTWVQQSRRGGEGLG